MPKSCSKCGAPAQKDDILCRKCGAILALRSGQENLDLEADEEEKVDNAVTEALIPEEGTVDRRVLEIAPSAEAPPPPPQPAPQQAKPPARAKGPSAGRRMLPILIIIVVLAGIAYFVLNAGPKECPPSCDDSNVCTSDTCGESTGFKCTYQNLTGEQKGCSSDKTCVETACSGGECKTRDLSNCCGNDKCESGEACTTCDDCTCEIGQSCSKNGNCRSGNCIGGKCREAGDKCGNSICDSGEGCTTCIEDCACASDSECVGNICSKKCGNGACGAGETCSSCPSDCGACKQPLGANCTAPSICLSGYCVHGVCRNGSAYCGDGYCDVGENCSACGDCCTAYGKACTKDSQCLGQHCVHKVCRNESTHCGDDHCDKGEFCIDDCGHYADFIVCTHQLNCNGNDTMTVELQREGMDWDYGDTKYCKKSDCVEIGPHNFEVTDVNKGDATLLVTKPDGTKDTPVISLGDCSSVGVVFVCLQGVE